jgi:hypothetical protein
MSRNPGNRAGRKAMFDMTRPIAFPASAAALLAALLLAPAPVLAQDGVGDDRVHAAAVIDRVITPETYLNRLAFLASDALMGRDTPSPSLEVAAEWLRSEHRRMGLEPGAGEGGFFQRWPYRQTRTDAANVRATITGPGGEKTLDLSAGAVRGGGDLGGDLVFVSNPTEAPEPGSLAGKVVVSWVDGTSFSQPWLQRLNQANAWAAAGGASASLVLVDEAFADMHELTERFGRPAWRMGMDMPSPQLVVPRSAVETVLPRMADLIVRAGSGESLWAESEGARMQGEVPAELLVDGRPANVVAILPGSDPALRDEFVVLSAHYDHVGVGTPMNGDSIYNGADDNGSGTVALLEVANALSQLERGPRRSIAFVHVSGEEKGLLGASWFVDHPPVPIEQMVANINADMIGGDAHRDTLVVIGKTYSTLGPLVDELNDGLPELGLTTSDDLWPEQRFFFRSDQFHFMRKEIPSLFFFTGIHECYHRPCDEVERLDIDKASRVARLLAHATLEVANRDERPTWNEEGLAEVRQLTGGGR